jgi:hypothetical protein
VDANVIDRDQLVLDALRVDLIHHGFGAVHQDAKLSHHVQVGLHDGAHYLGQLVWNLGEKSPDVK